MTRHRFGCFAALAATLASSIVGCNPKQPYFFHEEGALSHYVGVATDIEYPDVNECSLAEVEHTRAPLTLDNTKFDETWDLTLEEATRISLENSKVMRTLGGRIAINSTLSLAARTQPVLASDAILNPRGLPATVYDPAISEANPGAEFGGFESTGGRIGPEAALSAFDVQLGSSLFWDKVDRPQNIIPGFGAAVDQEDKAAFQIGLTKTSATGTQFSITNDINYLQSNSTSRLIPSDWFADVVLGVRQPLLQGAGVTFNRIAGPGVRQGFQGVLLARINTDKSLTEFEIGVRNLVTDVENAYWELYFAYRNLEARKVGRDSALATWRTTYAKFCAGARGGEAEKEAQAREQYFEFRGEVEIALTDLYKSENRLRYMLGLSASDGRMIRPKDEPTTAKIAFDWNQSQCEALSRSPELHHQKWTIKADELQLIAAKNYLLPRLDAVAQYRWLGLGDDLIQASRTGATGLPGSTAFESLTGGDFQEWEIGLQFSMPLGFRKEMSSVRFRQLQLARSRALLQDQELELTHLLGDAIRDLDTQYALMQTNFNRRVAAEKQVEAVQSAYDAGAADVTFDVLLNAQRRRSDAEAAYYRALVDYNKSVVNIHFHKGSLLEHNGVYLTEGPWPGKAYFDATKRARQRDASMYMNYGYTSPQVISQGPVEQSTGESGSGTTETLPRETLPTPAMPDQRMPTPAVPRDNAAPRDNGARRYSVMPGGGPA